MDGISGRSVKASLFIVQVGLGATLHFPLINHGASPKPNIQADVEYAPSGDEGTADVVF
jgi:hypothetical protein